MDFLWRFLIKLFERLTHLCEVKLWIYCSPELINWILSNFTESCSIECDALVGSISGSDRFNMGAVWLSIWCLIAVLAFGKEEMSKSESIPAYPKIMICILARNKAHALPYFLGQLEELDYPKSRLHLFIRSDHNIDTTAIILKNWTAAVSDFYGSIDYQSDQDNSDRPISYAKETGPFDWTEERYGRIIDLKEEALSLARGRNFDFILFLDVDNFLTYPRTLHRLIERKKPIIAPMLRSTSMYSNFWAGVDSNGYYLRTDNYEPIYKRQIQGCLPVPMVHSTFLINLNDPKTTLLTFDPKKLIGGETKDPTTDDVLVFARSARIAGIELNLLNTFDFGFLLEPKDSYEFLEDDIEAMRFLVLETLFYGPPGLLYSPFLNSTSFLTPKTLEPGNQFDKVYLINLRRRPDRRRRMEWCLAVLGVNATLVEAVDGKTLTDAYVYDELGIHLMPEYR